jgi:hypothetical protein
MVVRLASQWNDIVWVQKLLALNFIVRFSIVEEAPGPVVFPICNEVLTPKPGGPPDRYPLNQNNAAFINVLGWVFYLVPALLSGDLAGFRQMLFGLVGQVIVHGVIINSKLKTWYNPGLVAVMLGHVPLAILYFMEVFSRDAVRWWDLVFGLLYLGFFAGVIMQRIALMAHCRPTSRYPFR